jgi:hypothetical protein
MTTPRDPDRMIRAFLDEGEELLNDQIYDEVRAEIERKRQRTFIGPWRTPIMNKLLTYGLGAAAVVVILFGASQFFGSAGDGTGGDPTQTATAEATLEPTPEPSPTAAPPLTQSFTSTRHGISVSYPEGWTAQPATESWTGAQPNFGDAPADFVYDPALTDHLFVSIASKPIGDTNPNEWVAEELTLYECTASEPTTVDDATGLIGCNKAAVTIDGRGYVIALYTSGDEPWIGVAYDQAWFEEFLATVQLHPEDAVD